MIVRHAVMAMGTRFEMVLEGADEWSLRGAAESAGEEIEALHDRLSLFRSDSLVSHINRTAHERPVRLERPVFEMFRAGRLVWEQSGGAFDFTMGRAKLGEGVEGAGMDALVLDERTLSVSFSRSGPSIDLGGLAKGFALDVAGGVLREAGVTSALLHAGTSSVLAIGSPSDQAEGFRVALGPGGDGGAPAVVCLRDAALSVSAHRRADATSEEAGAPGHVVDPRTGASAEGTSGAGLAACVAGDGVLAEAWSTALLVLGERPAGMAGACVSVLRLDPGTGRERWRVGGDPAVAGQVVRI